jgi:DNA repair protein RadC
VTRDLIRAGRLLQIALLDHLIMGRLGKGNLKDYVSLRELGFFGELGMVKAAA